MEPGARLKEGGTEEESGDGLAGEVNVGGLAESGRSVGFDFARGWRVAAYTLLAGACLLLFLRRPETAFFIAALGVSAWFLNVRIGIKRKHDLVKDGARNWRPRRDVEE